MKILALEFSTERRSAAVAENGRVLGSAREAEPRASGPVALVTAALKEAMLEPAQIALVAVGLGPGSYHGVRVAIAMAQGWELALGVRLLGVESTTCLAWQAHAVGLRGPAHVVIDAHRGEWYLASYSLEEDGPLAAASLCLAGVETVRERVVSTGWVLGPGPLPNLPGVEQRLVVPDAATVARLAAGRVDFQPGGTLEPLYLREAAFVKAPAPRVVPRVGKGSIDRPSSDQHV